MVAAVCAVTGSVAFGIQEDLNKKNSINEKCRVYYPKYDQYGTCPNYHYHGKCVNCVRQKGFIEANRFYSKTLLKWTPFVLALTAASRVVDHLYKCERFEVRNYPRYTPCYGHAPITQKVGNFIMTHIWKPK